MRFRITDDEGNSFSASFDICRKCGYICPEQMANVLPSGKHYCPQCWGEMTRVVYTEDMMKLTVDMVNMFMDAMMKMETNKQEEKNI